ncbi:MAG: ArnT family glycosyltransferase [Chloroflexia bacterium]
MEVERTTELRNLALIVAGFVAVLLFLPPQHEYPIIDDWIYHGSVQHQLATGAFAMPNQAQANLVGQTLWATAWAGLLGLSYTTLTYSTLALALPGLLALYGIMREVDVPPSGALLGTVLFGLNPIFLHLSYSFMTDVPFISLLMVACWCYLRGLNARGYAWLLAGGLTAGWAFLIRQFAVLVPAGFGLYLLLDMLLTRRLRLRQLIGVGLLPALIVGSWWLWSRNMPPSGADIAVAARRATFFLKDPWPTVFLLRALAVMPFTALSAWTAIRLRCFGWRLMLPLIVALGAAWAWVSSLQHGWIAMTEPPGVVSIGPVTLNLPPEIDTFFGAGDILRSGGLDFYQYRQAPIWTPDAWRWLFVLGSILGLLLLAKMAAGLLDWLRACRTRSGFTPLAGLYLSGLMIFVVSLAATGDFYDRYLLGFLPFLIIFLVRGSRSWGRVAWGYALTVAVVWSGFSLLLKADEIAHDNARWQAGYWLAARAQPVQLGFDWNNIYGYSNGTYEITDVSIPGFRTERSFPYRSILSGDGTRYLLAQSRQDMPPLPNLP